MTLQAPHIVTSFDRDLEEVQALLMRMGGLVEEALLSAAEALETRDEELAARLAAWTPRIAPPDSGYAMMHHQHVMGADQGADLEFLRGCRGAPVGKDSH